MLTIPEIQTQSSQSVGTGTMVGPGIPQLGTSTPSERGPTSTHGPEDFLQARLRNLDNPAQTESPLGGPRVVRGVYLLN